MSVLFQYIDIIDEHLVCLYSQGDGHGEMVFMNVLRPPGAWRYSELLMIYVNKLHDGTCEGIQ